LTFYPTNDVNAERYHHYYLIFESFHKVLFTLSLHSRAGMNTNKLTFAALAAMAVALSVSMLVSSVAAPAAAKISPPSCTNPAGNEPPGQQPVCKGEGQTQNPALNPAGHAPPGQQP
jgi:hypothetical protein